MYWVGNDDVTVDSPSPPSLLLNHHRRSIGADHQHAAVGANGFIVDIDADDRIGAQVLRLLLHFFKRDMLGLPEFLFVGRRATTDDIPDRREKIPKDVRA